MCVNVFKFMNVYIFIFLYFFVFVFVLYLPANILYCSSISSPPYSISLSVGLL